MRTSAPRIGPTAIALALAACGQPARDGAAHAITYPGFAGHARYFPLVGGTHDGVDCSSCHGAFDTFAKVDCVTCHFAMPTTPDAVHAGSVSGYVSPTAGGAPASPWPYSQQQCLGCHPTGTSVMADHGRYFAVGPGSAHDLGCAQCHGSPRQDLAQQKCASCHVATDARLATAHAASPIGSDYGSASPLACLRCHALGSLVTIAAHPSFSGERLPHHGATCFTCHPGYRSDVAASPIAPATTPRPYAADFKSDPAACANLATRTGCYAASCHAHTSCPPQD